MSPPISGPAQVVPSGWERTAKSATPCVLGSNPVRILAWQLLVIGLAANSAGMALVDPQVVEVGSSAEQVTINLQPAE